MSEWISVNDMLPHEHPKRDKFLRSISRINPGYCGILDIKRNDCCEQKAQFWQDRCDPLICGIPLKKSSYWTDYHTVDFIFDVTHWKVR